MSHVVWIKTELKDGGAAIAAAKRCGCESFTLHGERGVLRLSVGSGPVYVDLKSGQVSYDENAWPGKRRERRSLAEEDGFQAFLQAYAVEKFRMDRAAEGLDVVEEAGEGGAIILRSPDAPPSRTGLTFVAGRGGAASLETTGYVGSGCKGAEAPYAASLGEVFGSVEAPAYYETVVEEPPLYEGA